MTNDETIGDPMTNDYLHCPRCGDESEIVHPEPQYPQFYIRCLSTDCGLESPTKIGRASALLWWEQKFGEAEIERLEKVNKELLNGSFTAAERIIELQREIGRLQRLFLGEIHG